MIREIGLLGILSLVLFTSAAAQDDDTPLNFEADGDVAFVNGVTMSQSLQTAKNFFQQNPSVQILAFEDVPGSADDETNLKIAKLIRQKGYATYLFEDSQIESGGVDLFIAGSTRTAECGAKVGVHSWAEDGDDGAYDGRDLPKNHPDHTPYISYYTEMGLDTSFYWYTLQAAPANGMYYMRSDEMEKYKVVTEPMNCAQ